jgi:hypothetical protein
MIHRKLTVCVTWMPDKLCAAMPITTSREPISFRKALKKFAAHSDYFGHPKYRVISTFS